MPNLWPFRRSRPSGEAAAPGGTHRGPALTGRELWTVAARGSGRHAVTLDPLTDSLYLNDGTGVTFASMRFRRLNLRTGREVAAVKASTGVRCFQAAGDRQTLLAATDTKLIRFEARSLKEVERWESRIPRHAASMAVRADTVLLAGWRSANVSIVDLATGSVRRRPGPALPKILDRRLEPLLVGGGPDGGVYSIDLRSATVRPLLETPPALDAALDADGRTLWLLAGVRGIVDKTSITPGEPSRQLCRYPLGASGEPSTIDLPVAVDRVLSGANAVWLASERAVLSIAHPVEATSAVRFWEAPTGQTIAAMDPDAGLVVTTRPDVAGATAQLTCFQLES